MAGRYWHLSNERLAEYMGRGATAQDAEYLREWIGAAAKPGIVLDAVLSEALDALEEAREVYELRGTYTKSGNPETFHFTNLLCAEAEANETEAQKCFAAEREPREF